MKEICKGRIKLTKKERAEGMNDDCHAYAVDICEDCGKWYCHKHIDRCRHECDDSVPGCHSMLGSQNKQNTSLGGEK